MTEEDLPEDDEDEEREEDTDTGSTSSSEDERADGDKTLLCMVGTYKLRLF